MNNEIREEQVVCRWVKASERLPELKKVVAIKDGDTYTSGHYHGNNLFCLPYGYKNTYNLFWLEENSKVSNSTCLSIDNKVEAEKAAENRYPLTFNPRYGDINYKEKRIAFLAGVAWSKEQGNAVGDQETLWIEVKEIIFSNYDKNNYPAQAVKELQSNFTITKK